MKRLISIVTVVVLFWTSAALAYTFSGIDIINMVGDYPSNHYDAVHVNWSIVSNGLDDMDFLLDDYFCAGAFLGGGFVYSEVEDQKCLYDYRPCYSLVPFQLRFFFCGSLEAPTENCLHVDFYVDESGQTFDGLPIILESDKLLYGYTVDVARVIEIGSPFGGGIILLEDVPIGSYDIVSPYGTAVLYLGTRSLSDLSGDGVCNFEDFNCMADDWQAPQGKYRGDISGIDGIPDGFVDFYDLCEIVYGWLGEE